MDISFQELFLNNHPLMDVRAPVEFQKGAFPTAINLPLLDDKQRHEIGICYKAHGQEKAIELGTQLFDSDTRSRRLDNWTRFTAANPNGYLYCFRGGLRSKITREWLADAGTHYPMIEGGYKAMRTYLIEQLEENSKNLPFIILGGKTGSGKTRLLQQLAGQIDLEGLASHRGSSFGALLKAQPGNIDFENALSIEMLRHQSKKTPCVFLEDEGRLIGRVCIPQTLRERMSHLPVVELVETMEHRISVAEEDYITDLLERYQTKHGTANGYELFASHHQNALHRIRKRFGGDRVDRTLKHFNDALDNYKKNQTPQHFHPYIEALLTEYYDPMYEYQFSRKNREVLFRGNTTEVLAWADDVVIT